ncbi:hypothetical protein JOC85_003061 [Bacillus mesophilus]|uniref:Uncharacterized protein n=1 Tax=Bacillus mesophilus TaxID=1808955 RepID=A0A6M0QBH4_9BACI|nr:hypothetical protein [Bacillus mesophilus]MBM7662254.1 hypothetical protein [Bacillus mesophilus]NEY73109.1 hypothetical protein [Bacillus mesophilus]
MKEEFKRISMKVDVDHAKLINEDFIEYHFFIRGYHGTKRIFVIILEMKQVGS